MDIPNTRALLNFQDFIAESESSLYPRNNKVFSRTWPFAHPKKCSGPSKSAPKNKERRAK